MTHVMTKSKTEFVMAVTLHKPPYAGFLRNWPPPSLSVSLTGQNDREKREVEGVEQNRCPHRELDGHWVAVVRH